MKKYCLAAALSMAFLTPVAKADMLLGLYAGVDGWQTSNDGQFAYKNNASQDFNFEDETFVSYYAALEHPIPLVPNVKLKYTELELNGAVTLNSTFEFKGTNFATGREINTVSDLTHIDYILYYEIFDNSLVSIDLGLNAKRFDGDITVAYDESEDLSATKTVNFSGIVPLAYGRAEAGLPFSGLSVFFEGSLLSLGDSKVQDYQAGVAWELIDNLAIDVAVKAGYRSMVLELDDVADITTDIDSSGPFAGIQVHF